MHCVDLDYVMKGIFMLPRFGSNLCGFFVEIRNLQEERGMMWNLLFVFLI
jgi:hypothetical protein